MKRLMIVIAAVAAFSVFAEKEKSVIEKYKEYSNARRYCVKRENVTINGVEKRITYWHRAGKPDTILPAVVTNDVFHIEGKPQNNPLQNVIVGLTNSVALIRAQYLSESNRAERASARTTRIREYLVEQKEAAKLNTTKLLIQGFIDKLDEITEKED